jgi:4-amino-4-deoxy-L-arabinose transferase-like glycosyltransferase
MLPPRVADREWIHRNGRSRARSARAGLLAVLGLCAILRAVGVLTVLATNPHEVVQVDSASYLRPALALLHGDGFLHAIGAHQPEFVRTPGYPLFIAIVYRVFGESHAALLLAQVVVSTITVFVVWRLGARMWSVGVALLASLLVIAEPLQWYTTGTILSESLATLFLVLVAAIGFRLFADDRLRWEHAALLGLAIALATIVRPVTYYLPLVAVAFLGATATRRGLGLRRSLQLVAALLLPLLVVVGGWQFRNHEQVGSWRVSGVEGKNLYLFRGARALADERGVTLAAEQRVLMARLGPEHGEQPGPYFDRMYSLGRDILVAHPAEAVAGTVTGLLDEITSTRSRIFTYLGMSPASGVLEGVAAALLLAFYALCGYGIVLVVRTRRDLVAHAFVLAVVAYVLLVSAGPEAAGGRGERFRAVIMPILALYAARGAYELARRAIGAEVNRRAPIETAQSV